MRIWLTTTICFGLMAALCGVSLAAQDSADPNGISQENLQTKEEGRSLQRQLLWEQVESIKEPANQPQTDTLDDLIRQLQSLEIPQKSISQEPNEPVPPQTDTAATSPSPEKSQAGEKLTAEDDLAVRLEKVEKVLSPLQLADVLYRQGHYQLAFENYCAVYERLSEDQTEDRQWILFQKANCCRYSDLNEAIRLYNELIKFFPNSKWTVAANSRLKIIEWGQLNQIRELVENETDDANS